jgi:hypothetical protein
MTMMRAVVTNRARDKPIVIQAVGMEGWRDRSINLDLLVELFLSPHFGYGAMGCRCG